MKIKSTIFKAAILFSCTFIFPAFTSAVLLHAQCALPTPGVVTPQYFCPGSTVADLVASGTNIKWYLSSSPTAGETPLPGTFPLDNGITYWVSQSNDECESYRSATTVVLTVFSITHPYSVAMVRNSDCNVVRPYTTGTITNLEYCYSTSATPPPSGSSLWIPCTASPTFTLSVANFQDFCSSGARVYSHVRSTCNTTLAPVTREHTFNDYVCLSDYANAITIGTFIGGTTCDIATTTILIGSQYGLCYPVTWAITESVSSAPVSNGVLASTGGTIASATTNFTREVKYLVTCTDNSGITFSKEFTPPAAEAKTYTGIFLPAAPGYTCSPFGTRYLRITPTPSYFYPGTTVRYQSGPMALGMGVVGSTITITSASQTYHYPNASGVGNSITYTDLLDGTYRFVVTPPAGCGSAQTVDIVVTGRANTYDPDNQNFTVEYVDQTCTGSGIKMDGSIRLKGGGSATAYFRIQGNGVDHTNVTSGQVVNLQASGNPYTVSMYPSSYACVMVSKNITVTNPTVTPVVAIAADPGISVCANTEVTFTATPINGGSSPSFQWKKGGVDIGGATSSTYKYTPATGDVITCVMTSNAYCATPATVTSTNSLTMTVFPQVAKPAVVSKTPACNIYPAGTANIVVTAPAGANYQYSLDGGAYQSGTTFTDRPDRSTPYILKAKNTDTGCESDTIQIWIDCKDCLSPPRANFSAASVSTCYTTPVSSTVTLSGTATLFIVSSNGEGTLSPSVESPTGTSVTYTPVLADAGKTIRITATTNNPAGAPCTSGTATWDITVHPNFSPGAITPDAPFVSSGDVSPMQIVNSTNAAGGFGAITYEWYKNGTPIAGSNNATYNIPTADRINLSSSNVVIEYIRKAKDATCETIFATSDGIYTLTVYPATFTITAIASSRGFINPSDVNTVLYGDDLTFTFVPKSLYIIDQVLIDGVNDMAAVAAGAYTFTNVTANHTIEIIFACPPFAYDAVNDFHTYNVIDVAGICWTKENLRARLYHDGTPIPFAKPYYQALYPDVEDNEDIFGLLYDWYSALHVENFSAKSLPYIQGICPDGWRLPTSEEFAMLNIYPSADLRNKIFWLQQHHNTNITGFDSRGAGYFNSATQRFEDLYGFTAYWSSDDPAGTISTAASFTYYCNLVETVPIKLSDAISVRCVMND